MIRSHSRQGKVLDHRKSTLARGSRWGQERTRESMGGLGGHRVIGLVVLHANLIFFLMYVVDSA